MQTTRRGRRVSADAATTWAVMSRCGRHDDVGGMTTWAVMSRCGRHDDVVRAKQTRVRTVVMKRSVFAFASPLRHRPPPHHFVVLSGAITHILG